MLKQHISNYHICS